MGDFSAPPTAVLSVAVTTPPLNARFALGAVEAPYRDTVDRASSRAANVAISVAAR